MKGYGWQCDFEQCGNRRIVAGDPFTKYHTTDLPEGWLVLIGPSMAAGSPEKWHSNERHFCSIRCLAAASAEQVA